MNELVIIVAAANNDVIGKVGKLPWPKERYKEDMQRFRTMTLGHPVIMGRKTFESLGSKPLKGRENIVVTSRQYLGEGVILARDLDHAVGICDNRFKTLGDKFVIGGEQIYKQSMNYADRIELTRIHADYEGDTYFPKIRPEEFVISHSLRQEGYTYFTYKRINWHDFDTLREDDLDER